ncbi:hypothetical protein NA57DRAFT_70002 [Rhizodiscina lignyota]|uniref:Zinc finger PHD-type domain-containing protein n=1 Tax=Rhizodiscina lignyota TaxID=1504668 RepID=A0A9P4MFS0_9PEZI|nr:hypothetical protein NA57DRAFT_70002 [Rhizodiscina lignyota]
MSPRRSSRARTTQPPASNNSTASIPSSTSSMRAERSTRSHNKQSSPQKSGTPQSALSSESGDGGAGRANNSEPPQSRRTRRGLENTETEEDDTAKLEDEELDDEIAEENEVTRCVCGQQEYPGPPEQRHGKGTLTALDSQSEEAGGLFIQCDICKVWQHGGCVGIMDEATSPDDYFCEQCKPEFHEISTSKNGQKYSLYIPIHEKATSKPHRKSSTSKEADSRAQKEREKAARADALAKRRSTMNSRSAYDEDEVLRAVLEQSRKEGGTLGSESSTRKGKRGRDDSEDMKQDSKRQRTASDLSSASRSHSQSPAGESDQEARSGKQKPRGAAARSQREKELREKERDRAEAANKRKGRADRRRAEESEQPNDTQDAARPPTAASDAEPSASQPPDTPHLAPSNAKGHKKGAGGKGKRGKNQWTRDSTQTPLDADTPQTNGDRKGRRDKDDASPGRAGRSGENTDGGSGREAAEGESARPATGSGVASGETSKGHGRGKPRQMNPHKTSMNEMRRKVHGMLNFVSQTQIDMASKKSFQVAVEAALGKSSGTPASSSTNAKTASSANAEAEKDKEKERSSDGKDANEPENGGASAGSRSAGSESLKDLVKGIDEFKELPTTEMMNLLSTRLVLWQQEYGKLGEK